MPLPRSYLYVPGDRAEVVAKAPTRGADALILDLEDAVAFDQKDSARAIVVEALGRGELRNNEVWVRMNALSVLNGHLFESDLAVAAHESVCGVIVAKVQSQAEIAHAIGALERARAAAGVAGEFGVVALLESAKGLAAATEIARTPGVARLQLGETDLAADLGLEVGEAETELLGARQAVVFASAANGLASPVGSVSTEIEDLERVAVTTRRLRQLGFLGRTVIHPRQIPIVHEVFTPSADDLQAARALLAAYDESTRAGSGVFIDRRGRMVDEAVVRSARRLLELDHTDDERRK